MRGWPADAQRRREPLSPPEFGAQAFTVEPWPINTATRPGSLTLHLRTLTFPQWKLASGPASRVDARLLVLTPPDLSQHRHYASNVRLVSALLQLQCRASRRETL